MYKHYYYYLYDSGISGLLEEVDCFKCLGSQDGGCERDVMHRMNEGYRAWGALKSVLSNRGLGIKAKKCLHEGVIVPTSLYGAEAMGMRSTERRKVNVLQISVREVWLHHQFYLTIIITSI